MGKLPTAGLVLCFWLYMQTVFAVVVFKQKWIVRLPGVRRFLRIAGVEDFVLKDQRQPCNVSHEGRSCMANFGQLSGLFFTRLAPYVLLSRLLLIAATQRSRFIPRRAFMASTKLILFIFLVCGIPGYIFCLTKRCIGSDRRGTGLGLSISSGVAGCSLLLLPQSQRRSIVTKIVTSSVIATTALVTSTVKWRLLESC